MSEFWKTVRSYRRWVGWVIVGLSLVLCIRMGWIDESFIDRIAGHAVNIIGALAP